MHGRILLLEDDRQLPPLTAGSTVTLKTDFVTHPLLQGKGFSLPSPTWVRRPIVSWHFEDSADDANLGYLQAIVTELLYGQKGLQPYRGQPRDLSGMLVVTQGELVWAPQNALCTQLQLDVTNLGDATLNLRLIQCVWGDPGDARTSDLPSRSAEGA